MHNADTVAEFDRRVKNIEDGLQSMGATYTTAKIIKNTLKHVPAQAVDWKLVHLRIAQESIKVHGQEPEDVVGAIAKHSPGAVDLESFKEHAAEIYRSSPEYVQAYELQRAHDDKLAREQNPVDPTTGKPKMFIAK